MKKRGLLWGSVVAVAVFLSGCSLQSNPSVLKKAIIQRQVDPQGLQTVRDALQKMTTVQTYEIKAQIQETAGRFTRAVNFYGTVRLPDSVYVDETIGGNDYLVYQDHRFAYYRDGNRWRAMSPVTNLRPWDSLRTLLAANPPKVVYALPEQTVVSWRTKVYQFTTTANAGAGTFGGIAPVQGNGGSVSQQALYTVWVDTTDGKLRQIEVQSTVGVPQLGTASIDATQLYFADNQAVKLPVPEDLLSQVENP